MREPPRRGFIHSEDENDGQNRPQKRPDIRKEKRGGQIPRQNFREEADEGDDTPPSLSKLARDQDEDDTHHFNKPYSTCMNRVGQTRKRSYDKAIESTEFASNYSQPGELLVSRLKPEEKESSEI